MRTKLLIVVASAALLVSLGVGLANNTTKPQPARQPITEVVTQPAKAQGYICPVTGEELPCPLCCPFYSQETKASTQAEDCCSEQNCCEANQNQQKQKQSYICPLTGEELPCPLCCPLNQKN